MGRTCTSQAAKLAHELEEITAATPESSDHAIGRIKMICSSEQIRNFSYYCQLLYGLIYV